MVLSRHRPKASPALEDQWASKALSAASCRDASATTSFLADLLKQLQASGYASDEAIEHPAAALLVAQLAELAGLHFHYPSHRLWQCQQLRAPSPLPADALCH